MSDLKESVELEQVPLKSDTDKPAEEEVPVPAGTETVVVTTKTADGKEITETKTHKVFFWRKNKGDKPAVEEGEEQPALVEGETPAEKKTKTNSLTRFFQQQQEKKKKKGGANGAAEEGVDAAENMTIGIPINMLDRDERNINEHVKLSYEDVFGEPDLSHSFDCVWRLNYRVFTWIRHAIYKLLALILVIPCAIIWGLVFAILTFVNVWACVPLGRALTIPATWIAKTWNFIIRSLFDPCFRSCGLCLSSVTVRRYGMSDAATAEHIA